MSGSSLRLDVSRPDHLGPQEVIVMNWLCVEVRYLFNKYHGSRDGGRRPDYPPSAHRMFQALTAAARLTKSHVREEGLAFDLALTAVQVALVSV
jgi:hypothetical protein